MSEAPTPELVPPSKIAEARAFLKSKQALDDLRTHYPAAFDELLALQPIYNAQLEAFAKVTKDRGVSCGPCQIYSYSRRYDGEILYLAVGRNKFAQHGGVIPPEKHAVDGVRFDALVEAGKIPPDLAAKVKTWTPSFHRPEPISVPT